MDLKKVSLEINVFVDIKNTMDGWYSRLEEKRIHELEYSFEEITSNCKKMQFTDIRRRVTLDL